MKAALRRLLFCLIFLMVTTVNSKAQSSYFPPLVGNTWDTVSPQSLGWCLPEIDSLKKFLLLENTKAFIVLKNGKIAIEKYYGTFTKDSVWYWASASKSLTAFLTGIAQEEQLLSINDQVSQYLGSGWTSCPPAKENLIKIKNQLSMTTGLDDGVPDNLCSIDTCLLYLADAGTRWAYHSGPYHLLEDVVAAAAGQTFQTFTTSRIKSKIGMQGFWFDYIFYSRARDMARFGLLCLNNGKWNSDTIMHDSTYFQDMIASSQNFNLAYGYLWWLNGKPSYMMPQSQFVFNGKLIPNAPDDTYAALGKNDQKIYVCPSLDLVVVRMGNAAGTPVFALSNFDNQLWGKLNQVMCNVNAVSNNETENLAMKLFPNPAGDQISIYGNQKWTDDGLKIYSAQGQLMRVIHGYISGESIDIKGFSPGIYLVEINHQHLRFVVAN